METTCDGFLGGRLQVLQPARGYRAATDPVYMAAACPARPGETVLELGCGVGVASLCLAARVERVVLHAVEVQPEYAALARQNAADNDVTLSVWEADLRRLPPALRALTFDHAIYNPPFFAGGTVRPPADAGRATAHVEAASPADWADCALRRVRPGGTVTVIQRAERLADVLSSLGPRLGDIRVLPIAARAGRAAGRVVVQGTKSARGPLRLLAPFVVHSAAQHEGDFTDFTTESQAVLRDGAVLPLG